MRMAFSDVLMGGPKQLSPLPGVVELLKSAGLIHWGWVSSRAVPVPTVGCVEGREEVEKTNLLSV